ncbi:MAG: zinc ribbon domain-containing protein [Chloroflexi bacterium]|nr:zinc ribbon domain-containing protein [Chloroflexota bacterium]
MPLYEFVCASCQHRFEVLRPISRADEPTSCPHCSNGAQRRVSRVASFSRGEDGELSPVAGSGPSCGGCSSTNCGTCSI